VDDEILNKRYQIQVCLDHARESLESAASSIEHGFYSTAINRAYYAIFYVASGLLLTKDISRSKHSGVIAAFRQYFVGPGLIEPEYSDLYGDVMDARVDGDYDMSFESDEMTATEKLEGARRFVERVVRYLIESEWF